MVLLKQRLVSPDYVIGIKGLQELDYLSSYSDRISMGSITTHRTLETSPVIKKELPMLVEMERGVASIQIRNWGTIGGNLCIGDPACDPAVALLALEAKVRVRSLRQEREIPLEEFFVDYLETALEPDEILVEIIVPRPEARTQGTYIKESVRAGDYGIASAAVVVSLDGGVIRKARIALGASGPTPLRAKKAEEAISGRDIGSALALVGSVAAAEAHPTTDIEGSEAYKRRIIEHITQEALATAVKRVQEG
jgi:carbon-monoxide dehydrogenase medium subunit